MSETGAMMRTMAAALLIILALAGCREESVAARIERECAEVARLAVSNGGGMPEDSYTRTCISGRTKTFMRGGQL
jgi:hypothetical protein